MNTIKLGAEAINIDSIAKISYVNVPLWQLPNERVIEVTFTSGKQDNYTVDKATIQQLESYGLLPGL